MSEVSNSYKECDKCNGICGSNVTQRLWWFDDKTISDVTCTYSGGVKFPYTHCCHMKWHFKICQMLGIIMTIHVGMEVFLHTFLSEHNINVNDEICGELWYPLNWRIAGSQTHCFSRISSYYNPAQTQPHYRLSCHWKFCVVSGTVCERKRKFLVTFCTESPLKVRNVYKR
jgi:hypothetical protein